MKKMMVGAVLVLSALLCGSAVADAPAHRTIASAIAKRPTVTITPAVDDVFVVVVLSGGHDASDPEATVSDNNSGTYWKNGGASWHQGNSKYARLEMFVRGTRLANTTSTGVAVDAGNTTTIAAVIAVSGLSGANNHPPVPSSCGTLNSGGPSGNPATVRQIKCVTQDQTGVPPFQSGETPVVPEAGQTAQFLTTSLLLAVLGNETNPNGTTVPSGFTSRLSVGFTAQGKTLGLSIGSLDSGHSHTGPTTTWGSTTASSGTGAVVEVQPYQ